MSQQSPSFTGSARCRTALCHTLLLIFLTSLVLSGCASKTLSTAVTLSAKGQEAVTTFYAKTLLSDAKLQTLNNMLIFNKQYEIGVLNLAADSDKEQEIWKEIKEYQTYIRTNTPWLKSLQDAYAALGELANYDATTNFDAAYKQLVTQTNTLASKLTGTTLPSIATDIFGKAAGQVLVLYQKHRIILASKAIKSQLEATIGILSDAQIKSAFLLLPEHYLRTARQTLSYLYNKKLVATSSMVNELISPFDMKAPANADQTIQNNKKLRDLFHKYFDEAKIRPQLEYIGSTYDENIKLLQALIKLHDALEQSGSLDPTQINILVSDMQAMTNNVASATN